MAHQKTSPRISDEDALEHYKEGDDEEVIRLKRLSEHANLISPWSLHCCERSDRDERPGHPAATGW